ncbi:hypothetical protein GMD68_05780 [Pseudoflavonifractor sp. BIOML-A13]|nr:hypothetical protein [Pseudoflavonifractor sp. BIOML-A13]MTR44983.1 hypothetical protein [Pseudoflavonifractor sp. BIOML-A13]
MSFTQFLEVDKMSVSVSRDERPGEDFGLEIFVAFQSIYRKYWKPAVEELGLQCFLVPTGFGKDKLEQALRELGLMREWTKKNVTGSDQEYILMRIEGLEKGLPEAFDREDTILYVG